MEVLVVLIAECLMIPVLAGIWFLVEAFLIFIFGAISFTLGVCSGRKRKEKLIRTRSPISVYRQKRHWWRRISLAMAVLLIVSLLVLVTINYLYFEEAVRFMLDKVKARVDIDVTFTTATGNFFSGRAILKDARIRRTFDEKSNFDLTAEEIAVDLDLLALLTFRYSLEYLHVSNLKGTFERKGKIDRATPRRTYTIDKLIIKNLEMTITDLTRGGQPIVVPLKIDNLVSRSFRSRMVIFDLLFKTSMNGLINQAPFTVETHIGEEEYTAEWTLHQLSVDQAGEYLFGDFNFLSKGDLDIEISNHCKVEQNSNIEMAWKMIFKNIEVQRPERLPRLLKDSAERLAAYLNDHMNEMAIDFRFLIAEQDFKDAVSLNGASIRPKLQRLFIRTLLQLVGENKEKIKNIGQKGIRRVKKFFEKHR